MNHAPISLAALTVLAGCASATLGDKAIEAELKALSAIPGKVSLYVCRSNAFTGGGVGAEAIVNGRSIGSLKVNTFAHTVVAPGKVNVFLRRTGIGTNSGDSGVLELNTFPGEVKIVWAGQAGLIGPVTVDNFSTKSDAEACIKGAEYAIP